MLDNADQIETKSRASAVVDMRSDVLVRVALLGMGLGVVAWIMTFVLSNYIIGVAFCAKGQVCTNNDAVAGNIALVFTAVMAILGLVRMGVYRPMLIAIAVCVTLWGVGGWLSGIVWYEALGWSALIFMASYTAFTWLVRPRNFIVVIIELILLIVAFRFIANL